MKYILSILIFCDAFLTYSQQDQPNLLPGNKVTTLTYWNVGDEITYQVSSVQTKSKKGKVKSKEEGAYKIKLKVVSATDSTYNIYGRYEYDNQDKKKFKKSKQYKLLKPVIDSLADFTYKYQITTNGAFNKVLNPEEVEAYKIRMLKLIKDNQNEITDTAMFNQVLVNVFNMFSVDKMYLEFIQLHQFYGLEHKLNKTQTFDIEFIHPLINVYLPGKWDFTLKSIEPGKDNASFNVKAYYDNDIAIKKMVAAVKELSSKKLRPEEEVDLIKKMRDMKVKTNCKFRMQLSSGVITFYEVKHEVTVKSENKKNLKVKKYVLIE